MRVVQRRTRVEMFERSQRKRKKGEMERSRNEKCREIGTSHASLETEVAFLGPVALAVPTPLAARDCRLMFRDKLIDAQYSR